jgi:hypothetical protein
MVRVADETPKPQADKFHDLARDLECDEDEKAFEETVRRVATNAPPKPTPNPD